MIESVITVKPFRFWCQKVLPLVYDDSLSYYELLCKVVDYINGLLEDDENVINLVNQLESFTTNYFNNLDVQEEINNKLDVMVENGQLDEVISHYVDPYIASQNTRITNFETTVNTHLSTQDSDINVLEARMDTFASLPTGSLSTDADAELVDIRVGADGTTYSSAGNAVRGQVSDLKTAVKGKETIKGTYQRASLYNGSPFSADYRVSEVDIVSYTHDLCITIDSGFKIGVHYFVNGSFTTDSGWRNNYFFIPKDTSFKFVIARENEDTSEIADIETFKNAVTFRNVVGTNVYDITGLNDDMTASNNGTQTFRSHGDFQPFGLNVDLTFLYGQKYRVSNIDPMTFDEDITVSVKTGFRWGYIPVVSGTVGTWSGWFTTPTKINAGTSFVVQIARVTEDTSEIANVDEFLNAVTFPNKAGKNADEIVALSERVEYLADELVNPESMPLEQGAIYGGADSASNNYVRTQGFIYMPAGSKVNLGNFNGQLVYAFYYYNQPSVNGFLQSDPNGVTVNANTEAVYTTILDGYVRLRVQRGSETALAPTDLNGVITYETNQIQQSVHEKSVLSLFGKYAENVPSFDAKLLNFTSLINGNDSDSYLFFTDPHIFGANGTYSKMLVDKYMSAVQHCYYHSPCSFVVCGGDWLNNGDTASQAKQKLAEINGMTRRLFGSDYYPMVGNHDTNYLGSGANAELSEKVIANLWNGKRGKNYFDFKSTNARYYILDTGEENQTTMTDYRWNQIDWLANQLIRNDDTHAVIMFHILYLGSIETAVSTMAQDIGLIIQAYNGRTSVELNETTYDFSQCSGKIDYSLAGHSHADFTSTLGGVPVIGSVNMQSGGTPSFDLINVDYTAMKFYAVRIGNGNDRTINL